MEAQKDWKVTGETPFQDSSSILGCSLSEIGRSNPTLVNIDNFLSGSTVVQYFF